MATYFISGEHSSILWRGNDQRTAEGAICKLRIANLVEGCSIQYNWGSDSQLSVYWYNQLLINYIGLKLGLIVEQGVRLEPRHLHGYKAMQINDLWGFFVGA